MKKTLLILALLFSITFYAQEERTVTITVVGQGKTKEEAKEYAIQNAINQIYGTFISSKKEILNNKAINDEIVLSTNGNIKKTDIISEIELPNIGFVITLKVTISVDKLTSFIENKGEIVEFKGGAFSQIIKLQKLNEEAEKMTIDKLCLTSFEILKKAIDFNLKYSQPSVVGDQKDRFSEDGLSAYKFNDKYGYYLNEYKPDDFKITFTVIAKPNDNYIYFSDNFQKTIASLSMTKEEADEYVKLNKEVSTITIDDIKYYLRNPESINDLHIFFIKCNIIPMTFMINSNAGEINFLLKNRFNCFNIDTNEYNSFINARTLYYNFSYDKYQPIDRYKDLSSTIFSSSNIYPYYRNFFSSKVDFSTNNTVIIYGNNSSVATSPYKIETSFKEILEKENNIVLNTKKNFETSFTFDEYFTLKEIETIDNFTVSKFDLTEVLAKEEDRMRKIKLVKLVGGSYESYEDFYGRKFNDYMTLIGNGTIANIIDDSQTDKILVKIYKTKCGENNYCNSMLPGALFYLPANKLFQYLNESDLKNKKGEIFYQFN